MFDTNIAKYNSRRKKVRPLPINHRDNTYTKTPKNNPIRTN